MDWLEDDGMMRQWEDVCKEDEKFTVRRMVGKSLQVEGVQKAPKLLVSQVLKMKKEPNKEKKIRKVAGWSTEKMKEKSKRRE